MRAHFLASILVASALMSVVRLPPAFAVSDIIQMSPQTSRLVVKVWAGRITAIDFSPLNQRITSIALADPSRLVYNTDVPMTQGTATTLYLRQIQPLHFPGTTTTSVTNLIVKTNTRQTYVFNVVPVSGKPEYSVMQLSNQPASQTSTADMPLTHARINLDWVEAGLQVAIARRYATADDPLLEKIQQFLRHARCGVPLAIAAETANVSRSLILKLHQLGREQLEPLSKSTKQVPRER